MSCIPLFNGQIPHFHDARGNLANGFKLHFYLHNTSTPIDVFKDAEGRVAYTNPIVLDARGETETQIYVNPSFAYKMVLKDRKGAVVYSADSITADGVVDLPEYIMGTVEGSELVSVQTKVVGENIKYIVYMNDTFSDTIATKDEIEDLETALGNVKETFYFNNNTAGSAFADAYSKGKFLVYQKSVTSGAPRPETTTRNFVLVSENQRAGGSSVTLLFACLEGETIYKVSIGYNLVAHTLTFGDVESYAVKDKDDELASTIASYQEATNESLRTMGTTLSQGLNQLEVSKLSAVSHDATLEGDGTEANPLKVIGGGQGCGIPEAPEDGKQYARKDGEWAEVEAGASSWEDISGKPSTFPPSSHTHTKSQITDLVVPTKTSDLQNDSGFIDKATFVATYNTTTFADIASAVESGYCVKCDMSGYTYELVQALSDKITFALTNNVNGTISQETIWVTSDDEWDGEGVNVAKASDVIADAPADGKPYARKNNAWAEVRNEGEGDYQKADVSAIATPFNTYEANVFNGYENNVTGVSGEGLRKITINASQNIGLIVTFDMYGNFLPKVFLSNGLEVSVYYTKDITSYKSISLILNKNDFKFVPNVRTDSGIVVFDGVEHSFCKIGSRLWTCPLKCPIGTYIKKDEQESYYYQIKEMFATSVGNSLSELWSNWIETKASGWRYPLSSDLDDLQSRVGSSYIARELGGTDIYGFNSLLGGYCSTSGSFYNYGLLENIKAYNPNASSNANDNLWVYMSTYRRYTEARSDGYNSQVRLCKDV